MAALAVFALAAMSAAAASAATPEFKPVPAKKKFTASAATVTLVDGEGDTIECSKGSAVGEITGARTVGSVVETFTGCKAREPRESCSVSSYGAKAGEIVTRPLMGELGTVPKAQDETEVGLRLKQEPASKFWYVQVGTCIFEKVVQGSVAGQIGAPGGKQTKHEFAFKLAENGTQAIKEITLDSGELEKPHFGGGSSSIFVLAPFSLTFEEAVEI